MKVSIVRILAVAVLGVSIAIMSAGLASADDFTGSTYSDARATAAQKNAEPVIATVNGDKLAIDDCIVTSWRQSMFLDTSQNGAGRTNEILFNLNCNALVASAGVPGNSAATPEGRAAKKEESDAEYLSQHMDKCYASDDALQYCQRICKKTGKCEV
jgi:hypothetical protein